jgi:hypothetical protein
MRELTTSLRTHTARTIGRVLWEVKIEGEVSVNSRIREAKGRNSAIRELKILATLAERKQKLRESEQNWAVGKELAAGEDRINGSSGCKTQQNQLGTLR